MLHTVIVIGALLLVIVTAITLYVRKTYYDKNADSLDRFTKKNKLIFIEPMIAFCPQVKFVKNLEKIIFSCVISFVMFLVCSIAIYIKSSVALIGGILFLPLIFAVSSHAIMMKKCRLYESDSESEDVKKTIRQALNPAVAIVTLSIAYKSVLIILYCCVYAYSISQPGDERYDAYAATLVFSCTFAAILSVIMLFINREKQMKRLDEEVYKKILKKVGLSSLVFVGYALLSTVVISPILHIVSSYFSNSAEEVLLVGSISGLVTIVGFYLVVVRGIKRIWKKPQAIYEKEEDRYTPVDEKLPLLETADVTEEVIQEESIQEELIENTDDNELKAPDTTKSEKRFTVSFPKPHIKNKSKFISIVLGVMLGFSVIAIVICGLTISEMQNTISNLKQGAEIDEMRIEMKDNEIVKLNKTASELQDKIYNHKEVIEMYEKSICFMNDEDKYYHILGKCARGHLTRDSKLCNTYIAENIFHKKPCPDCY